MTLINTKSRSNSLTGKNPEKFKELSHTAFADFETIGLGGDFICGGIVGLENDDVFIFENLDNFFSEMINPDLSLKYKFIYFHNLEYDARYIIKYLIKNQIAFEVINRVTRVLMIKFLGISIIDSYALLMDSLKNLSKIFSPEHVKQELDFDAEIFDINNPTHKNYLIEDCLALKHCVINARKTIHNIFGVNAKYTTSSTALSAWRTTIDFEIFRLSKEKEEFVRKSYAGGLVYQPFIDVFKDVYIYDFNSMYPSVMRDNLYPFGTSWITGNFEGIGFYHVRVNATHAKFLFLTGYVDGIRYSRCKAQFFDAYITDTEYKLAIELGYVLDIKIGVAFEQSKYLFTDFVDKCEQIRLNNPKNSLTVITKFLQNSLYGKFGTKKEREQILYNPDFVEGRTPYIDPQTGEFLGMYVDIVDADESYMLPHLASYTTALARCKLVRAIVSAGIDNVIYADTDSLFVNEKGKDRIQHLILELIYSYHN